MLKGPRPDALKAEDWLQARGGWKDDGQGRQAYVEYLREIGRDEPAWEREGLVGLSRGWAIGTYAWRQAIAKQHSQRSLSVGLPREERVELREASWAKCLEMHLAQTGKISAELATKPRKQKWKVN